MQKWQQEFSLCSHRQRGGQASCCCWGQIAITTAPTKQAKDGSALGVLRETFGYVWQMEKDVEHSNRYYATYKGGLDTIVIKCVLLSPNVNNSPSKRDKKSSPRTPKCSCAFLVRANTFSQYTSSHGKAAFARAAVGGKPAEKRNLSRRTRWVRIDKMERETIESDMMSSRLSLFPRLRRCHYKHPRSIVWAGDDATDEKSIPSSKRIGGWGARHDVPEHHKHS